VAGHVARATPLIDEQRALGARFVDFAGWSLPVSYTDMTQEHEAVRTRAGLFDVCHMGEILVEGEDAAGALSHALVTDPPKMPIGKARYSMICAPDAGIIDDLIVYRLREDGYMVVANASNVATVVEELTERSAGFRAKVEDASDAVGLIALQGPESVRVLSALTKIDVSALPYYSVAEGEVAGVSVRVARTGYTGEDGFELFVGATQVVDLWRALLEAGDPAGLRPCGLGARDTLRLEAGMPLYGNELDRDTNPFEAGFGRIVHLEKPGDFVGREALSRAAARGARRKQLVGLEVTGRGIARHGYPLFAAGGEARIGVVTSGTVSPTLGKPIAMAYVQPPSARIGMKVEVEIRGKRVDSEVVPLPFYRRATT
jgi:aminomethyltransferase